MIKNVIFDIGNVLIDFCWKKHMQNLGFNEETIEVLGKNMINNPLWNELDKNQQSSLEIVEIFKKENPEYINEINMFFETAEGFIEVYPNSSNWLKGLKDKGYNVYLLSNYPEREFNIHLAKFDFVEYTDGRIVSYEVKITKPQRGIYDALRDKFNLNYDECVFLDDKLENVEAADLLGMYTIRVKSQEQAMKELDLLLQNN